IKPVIVKPQIGACTIAARLCVCILVLTTNFDRVVPLDHREVLLPVIGSIGSRNNWVSLDAAHDCVPATRGSEVPKIVHSWDAKVLSVVGSRPQRTSVNTQIIRVDVIVHSNALRKALVPNPAFQDFVRTDGPRVIDPRQLSS